MLYREARTELWDHLSPLQDFCREACQRLRALTPGASSVDIGQAMSVLPGRVPPGMQTSLQELIEEHGGPETLRMHFSALRFDLALGGLLQAEPPAMQEWQKIVLLARWLENCELLDFQLAVGASRQAATRLPPEPGFEITGAQTLDYLQELQAWVRIEAEELWGETAPDLKLPVLGTRYLLGDFEHACRVGQLLARGADLRRNWLQIADCGDRWDDPQLGCSRSMLLFFAANLSREIVQAAQEPLSNCLTPEPG